MLRVLNMTVPYKYKPDVPKEKLFDDNVCFIMEIEAPIFWWVEYSGERTAFDLKEINKYLETKKRKVSISTSVKARIFINYQDIVEICEDYILGEYTSQWKADREWADFCETLMDIKGIRDLLYGEEI